MRERKREEKEEERKERRRERRERERGREREREEEVEQKAGMYARGGGVGWWEEARNGSFNGQPQRGEGRERARIGESLWRRIGWPWRGRGLAERLSFHPCQALLTGG